MDSNKLLKYIDRRFCKKRLRLIVGETAFQTSRYGSVNIVNPQMKLKI